MQKNKMDETNQHVIAGCSSLSECAYGGRHNQLANIIHQQTAIKYKPLDRNTPPYCRYKPQPVLISANEVLYWDRSVITDTAVDCSRPDTAVDSSRPDTAVDCSRPDIAVDCSRPDTAPIDRQNKTTLVIDTAVPLNITFPKLRHKKIPIYENLALEIKNIWKLNNISICPLVISTEGVVIKVLKYLQTIG
jgi:hypothetical protein